MSHYLFTDFQLLSLTMEHKGKHYCAVLFFITYLEDKKPIKRLILIYRFSGCVTNKAFPCEPNASCDVLTRKGI